MFSYFKIHELLIGIIALLLLVIGVRGYGGWEHHKGIAEQLGKDKAASLVVQAKGQAVTTKVITHYVTRIQVIHDVGATIIKKVPVYVTHTDSSRCIVNNGFVQLWNEANKMQLSNTPSATNESPSDVILSDIAAQHVRETNIFYQQQEQLKALQQWIMQEQQAYK